MPPPAGAGNPSPHWDGQPGAIRRRLGWGWESSSCTVPGVDTPGCMIPPRLGLGILRLHRPGTAIPGCMMPPRLGLGILLLHRPGIDIPGYTMPPRLGLRILFMRRRPRKPRWIDPPRNDTNLLAAYGSSIAAVIELRTRTASGFNRRRFVLVSANGSKERTLRVVSCQLSVAKEVGRGVPG